MIKLLAFDMDGTLIDSAGDICIAMNRMMELYKKPRLENQLIISHIGEGLRKLLMDFFPEITAEEKIIKLEREFLDMYEEEMFNLTSVFDGVDNFLTNWSGQIAIITNKNEAPAKALVKHLGLDQFSWVKIYGADSLAERKPSPLPLQTLMKLSGCAPHETLMIGDGTPDLLSAQRAGVGSIGIGFGYTDINILNSYRPLAILDHYDNLATLIREIQT